MIFHGFQKLTLLDFPGHMACTVFTGGCNFRCPFCHNALLVTELSDAERYESDDILSFLDTRRGILDGVAITGGEPLLTDDIFDFMREVRARGFRIKLDTNGSFPDRLKRAVSEGLVDYVAMDVKNRPEKYAATVGVPGLDLAPIRESVSFLLSGAVDCEFRTTVVEEFHTVEDIQAIGAWLSGARRYYLQHFEDSGNLITDGLHAVPKDVMGAMRDAAAEHVENTVLRGV